MKVKYNITLSILIDDRDVVMICLSYFLECGIMGKNKKVVVFKDSLLLASNVDDFYN